MTPCYNDAAQSAALNLCRHSGEQIFAPAKSAFPPSMAVKPESSLFKYLDTGFRRCDE